jgi:hypothetical protein
VQSNGVGQLVLLARKTFHSQCHMAGTINNGDTTRRQRRALRLQNGSHLSRSTMQANVRLVKHAISTGAPVVGHLDHPHILGSHPEWSQLAAFFGCHHTSTPTLIESTFLPGSLNLDLVLIKDREIAIARVVSISCGPHRVSHAAVRTDRRSVSPRRVRLGWRQTLA